MPSQRRGHERHRSDELLLQHDPVDHDGQLGHRQRQPERQRLFHAEHDDRQLGQQHRHDHQQHVTQRHIVDGCDGHGLDQRQLFDDAGLEQLEHEPVDGRLDGQQHHRHDAEHRHHVDEVMMRSCTLVLAAAMSLGLAACERARQDTGDTTAGTQAPSGTSGKGGTNAMGGPGSGLAGGMNPQPGKSTGVAEGTANSTRKGAVGNR